MSRPVLADDTLPYWNSFLTLARDRQHHSVGMAGVLIPIPISRETIRREGMRLGRTDEDLDDFVEIVVQIDDIFIEVQTKYIAEDAKHQLAVRQRQNKKR